MKENIIFFYLLFFLLIPQHSVGQVIYQGEIINDKTGAVVPYITVRLIRENVSVAADENGKFKLLSTKIREGDTLLIKGIGFVDRKLAITDYREPLVLKLVERIETLADVNITFKKISRELNALKKSGYVAYLFTYQVAQEFDRPEDCSILKMVKIGIYTGFFNTNLKSKFRIRIYDKSEQNSGPGEDLCLQKIEVEHQGDLPLEIDLTRYNIAIPNDKFYVAIEKLLIPINERYRIDRDVSHATPETDEEKARTLTYYEPIVYYKKTEDRRNWSLDFAGDKWKARKTGIIGISAIVTN